MSGLDFTRGLLEQCRPFAFDAMPNPPQWARDRVDEICGGPDMTDDMPNIVYLRMAEYVAAREAEGRS